MRPTNVDPTVRPRRRRHGAPRSPYRAWFLNQVVATSASSPNGGHGPARPAARWRSDRSRPRLRDDVRAGVLRRDLGGRPGRPGRSPATAADDPASLPPRRGRAGNRQPRRRRAALDPVRSLVRRRVRLRGGRAGAAGLNVLDLVGSERAASAVGLYEVVQNVSRVLGPAVGGLLVATGGISACFIVNAALYLAPIAALLRYRPAHGLEPAPPIRAWRYQRGPPLRAPLTGNPGHDADGDRLRDDLQRGGHAPARREARLPPRSKRLRCDVRDLRVGAVGGALLAAGGGPWPTGRRSGCSASSPAWTSS